MKSLRWCSTLVFAACCLTAHSQGILIPVSHHAVQAAPFTLTLESRQESSSAPGTHVSTVRILRDSAGRQRYESRVEDGVPRDSSVRIYDVVAGRQIELNMDAKTAVLSPMQAGHPVQLDISIAASLPPSVSQPNQTLLGTREIAGLEAWGETTHKIVTRPNGYTFTQDRELWTSTHYAIPLLQILRRESGTITQTVTSFDPAEPDPSLFQIPPDFAVSDAPPPRQPAPGTVPIGGNVSAPVVIKQVSPEFSEQARQNKVNGDVLVSLVVDENGAPQDVKVTRGIGYGLDEKAVEAVRKYRFRPALQNGKPVKVEMSVSVNFKISKVAFLCKTSYFALLPVIAATPAFETATSSADTPPLNAATR